MITVEQTKDDTTYHVLSDSAEHEDMYVTVSHKHDVLTISQYEHPDDEECQYIELTPRLAYSLYGILKATLVEHEPERISKGS